MVRARGPKFLGCDTAEANVRHAGVRTAAVAGAGAVTRTVRVMAQKRATALAARRCSRIARVHRNGWPGRVDDHTVPATPTIEIRTVEVTAPLPDVTVHVVQTPGIGQESPHQRGAPAEPARVTVAVVGLVGGDGTAKVEGRGRGGAASILPLRLRRQPVGPALALAQSGNPYAFQTACAGPAQRCGGGL